MLLISRPQSLHNVCYCGKEEVKFLLRKTNRKWEQQNEQGRINFVKTFFCLPSATCVQI